MLEDEPIDLIEPIPVDLIEPIPKAMIFAGNIDLSTNINFIIQLTILLLFSAMITGFAIKKLLHFMKG